MAGLKTYYRGQAPNLLRNPMPLDEYSSKKKLLKLDGIHVAFVEEGEGHPLVMLHGFPTSAIWRKVLPLLATNFRCVAIDTLGLGDSMASLDHDFSLKGQADMINALLKAKRINKFSLLGHDIGGAIAQILATQDPKRIEKLVLADCPAYDNWPSNYLKGMILMARLPTALHLFSRRLKGVRFARSTKGWGHGFFDRRILTQELASTYFRPLASSAERIQRLKRLLLSLNNRETIEVVPSLRQFQRPAMVLWSCDNRHRSPSWAIKLYHDIPGAKRFELIPFSGLFSPEEKPEEFAQIVINFLSPQKKKVNSKESNSQREKSQNSLSSVQKKTKE